MLGQENWTRVGEPLVIHLAFFSTMENKVIILFSLLAFHKLCLSIVILSNVQVGGDCYIFDDVTSV